AETIAFTQRELLSEIGGFYSSLNADSEKIEGKFYVWSYEEISNVLTESEFLVLSDYWNISEEGNWEEGKNILHLTEGVDALAQRYNFSAEVLDKMVSKAKQKLLSHRSNRIRPETDTKILTSWNALMAKGLIDAYAAFGNQEYLDLALATLDFLLEKMLHDDGKLYRNFAAGKAAINGFLDDYAFLSEALLSAYQATFQKSYLDKAIGLIDYCLQHFKSSSGSLFYYTSSASQALVVRKMEISDNVIPASNSLMANVLYQAGRLSSREDWVELAKEMVSLVAKQVETGGTYYANWASLIIQLQSAQREVVITGNGWEEALKTLLKLPLTGTVFAGGMDENLPMIQGRVEASQLQIFICENHVCNMPVHSEEEAVKLLRSYN
ncbi:MAG: thioredoxin domain-containing protein, partial [Bacteroidales bacterium]|nr:thioredoxin domain-containing protein [Bacteroidales bacterium]